MDDGAVPLELTSFVGRDDELRAIDDALASARLVTLVGPGGCGKTRLAIRAAREAAGFESVHWADLSAIDDPAAVIVLVAAALGVLRTADGDAVGVLAGEVADRRLLLCLDNCEHVLEAAADVVDALLRRCPRLTVLCTSREALRVPGELAWQVPPMNRADAVRLFAERAQGLGTAATDPIVATACARMEGMPLAVELAAAWSGTLSPREILDGLDDRFRLLIRGPYGVAARHQTLAASMAWSHGLLDPGDRDLFERLGVFRGGFTTAAAQALCADEEPLTIRESLRRLVEKSLLTADTHGPVTRFRMLETVREYAERQLTASGTISTVRDRHLEACLALTQTLRPLIDTDKDAWRASVAAEYENLHAALAWGLSREDTVAGRRLAAELPWLWHADRRGREGLKLLRRAVELGENERTALQARLLTALALVADTNGPTRDDTAARAFALAEAVDEPRTACLALTLVAIDRLADDLDAAQNMAADARARAEHLGDGFVHDSANVLMGIVHHLRDDHRQAALLLEDGLHGLMRRADREVASTACGLLAISIAHSGDLHRASELAHQALALAEPLGDYHRIGTARVVCARVALWAERPEEAWAALDPILRIVEGIDPPPYIPGFYNCVGDLHRSAGDAEQAARWYERDLTNPSGLPDHLLAPQSRLGLAHALRTSEAPTAAKHAALARRAAQELGMPGLLADAIEVTGLLADDPKRAEHAHHEALVLRADHGLHLACVSSLEHLAALAEDAGAVVEAARLLGACDRARVAFGLPPRPGDLSVAAGEEGRSMTLEEAIAYARRARGTRSRPTSGWASLTPTEVNVVELAITGMTNPEIAGKLFMSRATVKTHLSHAYTKLDIANRTQLAHVKPD